MRCVLTIPACRARLAGRVTSRGLMIRRINQRLLRNDQRPTPRLRELLVTAHLASECAHPTHEIEEIAYRANLETDKSPLLAHLRWDGDGLFRGRLAALHIAPAPDGRLILRARLLAGPRPARSTLRPVIERVIQDQHTPRVIRVASRPAATRLPRVSGSAVIQANPWRA